MAAFSLTRGHEYHPQPGMAMLVRHACVASRLRALLGRQFLYSFHDPLKVFWPDGRVTPEGMIEHSNEEQDEGDLPGQGRCHQRL